jgi:hypothetical protein
MTEAEWLACNNLQEMLDYLPTRASNRKLRLFACACCRRIWPLLEDRGRNAVSVAERFVDGFVSDVQFEQERHAAQAARGSMIVMNKAVVGWAYAAACAALFDTPVWNDRAAAEGASGVAMCAAEAAWRGFPDRSKDAEYDAQLCLLRDIVENPYRPGWVEPAWLESSDGAVVNLAQAIYDRRAFERMPELGEALERAGCGNKDVLDHCRQPGEHVRGCWVVDLILGKS